MWVHSVFYYIERNEEEEWMYKVEVFHRKPNSITLKQKDSINETIHYKRFQNKNWLLGQYIPDSIDTLTLFNTRMDSINQMVKEIDRNSELINKIQ